MKLKSKYYRKLTTLQRFTQIEDGQIIYSSSLISNRSMFIKTNENMRTLVWIGHLQRTLAVRIFEDFTIGHWTNFMNAEAWN